jgi:hypothetical protein
MLLAPRTAAPEPNGLLLIGEISKMTSRLVVLERRLRETREKADKWAVDDSASVEEIEARLARLMDDAEAEEECKRLKIDRRHAAETLCTFLAEKIRRTHGLFVSMSFDRTPEKKWDASTVSEMILDALEAAAKSKLMGRDANTIVGLGPCNTCHFPAPRFGVQGRCPCFAGRPACTCLAESGRPFHPMCSRCFLNHYVESWSSQIVSVVSSAEAGFDGDVEPFVACPSCAGVLCPFDAFAYDASEMQATHLSLTLNVYSLLQEHGTRIEKIEDLGRKHIQHYAKPASLIYTKAAGIQRALIKSSESIVASLEMGDVNRIVEKKKAEKRRMCDWCELLAHYPKKCEYKEKGYSREESIRLGNEWAEAHGTREKPTNRKAGKKRSSSRRGHRHGGDKRARSESVHSTTEAL